ncbi:hypothetical protein B0H21DRAFT_886662 [Amylocystis lapponica]|nr:hypothetical protein B0H21DRAFT_886662 [Amylocystis lapponica]
MPPRMSASPLAKPFDRSTALCRASNGLAMAKGRPQLGWLRVECCMETRKVPAWVAKAPILGSWAEGRPSTYGFLHSPRRAAVGVAVKPPDESFRRLETVSHRSSAHPCSYQTGPYLRRRAAAERSKWVTDKFATRSRRSVLERYFRNIFTLNPTRLTPLDYIDISGLIKPVVSDRDVLGRFPHVVAVDGRTKPLSHADIKRLMPELPLQAKFAYSFEGYNLHRFPAETHGFLYYHPAASPLAVASEIRFRIMPDVSTIDLLSGRDLLLPTGRPWGIQLCDVASRACYRALKEILLRDQLVTSAMLEDSTRLSISPKGHMRRIYSLDEPFYVGFSKHRRYYVVGDDGEETDFHGTYWFADNRARSQLSPAVVPSARLHRIFKPYNGSAMCRFVRSALPGFPGVRTLLLRVVEILKPAKAVSPEYDGYVPMPKAGELCHVGSRPWRCVLDREVTSAALRTLCDRDWLRCSRILRQVTPTFGIVHAICLLPRRLASPRSPINTARESWHPMFLAAHKTERSINLIIECSGMRTGSFEADETQTRLRRDSDETQTNTGCIQTKTSALSDETSASSDSADMLETTGIYSRLTTTAYGTHRQQGEHPGCMKDVSEES